MDTDVLGETTTLVNTGLLLLTPRTVMETTAVEFIRGVPLSVATTVTLNLQWVYMMKGNGEGRRVMEKGGGVMERGGG